MTARSRLLASPTTYHGSSSTSKEMPWRAAAHAGHRAVDDVGEVDLADHAGHRLVAGQLDQVADQGAQLLDLGADVVEQLEARLGRQRRVALGLAEQVEVGAQRGERRAQLVAGVGHQPALPVARRGEREQHLVERRGQAGDLVVALDPQRRQVLGAGDALDRGGEAAYRAAGRCGPPASPASSAASDTERAEDEAARRRASPACGRWRPATGRAPAPGRCPACTVATRNRSPSLGDERADDGLAAAPATTS